MKKKKKNWRDTARRRVEPCGCRGPLQFQILATEQKLKKYLQLFWDYKFSDSGEIEVEIIIQMFNRSGPGSIGLGKSLTGPTKGSTGSDEIESNWFFGLELHVDFE